MPQKSNLKSNGLCVAGTTAYAAYMRSLLTQGSELEDLSGAKDPREEIFGDALELGSPYTGTQIQELFP